MLVLNQLSIQVEPIYHKSYAYSPTYLGLEIILEFPSGINKELESFLFKTGFFKSIVGNNLYSLTLLNVSKEYKEMKDYLLNELDKAFKLLGTHNYAYAYA